MRKSDCPQRAIILAAGLGSRLRPLTNMRPKPLVEVHGVPILHNALRQLDAVGVREATIVVGYRKDAIEYACGSRFGNIDISYVESSVFDRTGSAYSLWLARSTLLAGDVFLLEGDIFFEETTLIHLIEHGAPDVAAVAPFDDLMEGSAVVLTPSGFISEVLMKQTSGNSPQSGGTVLFKTMNIFRFSSRTLRNLIVPALDDLVGSGAMGFYTEQVLASMIRDKGLALAAARCDDLKWYEIDSEEDLRIAENIFSSGRHTALAHTL